MIQKMELQFGIIYSNLFYDSRADAIILLNTMRILHDKINELVDEVNKLKGEGNSQMTYEEMLEGLMDRNTPMTPIPMPEEETFYDGGYFCNRCPSCNTSICNYQNFCDNCGQRINWDGVK